ncbi:MAG TPA: phytoene/squalene synthase family protein [Anaerolineales bacterium]|nr:phytoene/squalene synthase family protein [Anaerolineales bacterium]
MQIQAGWENHLLALAGHAPYPSTRPFFSYWAGDASLRQAYSLAARIAREHSKSFYMASGLLPEEKRAAVRALYAFCRTVDDIVDEESGAGRAKQLDGWREIVQSASAPDGNLVAAAWADSMTRYHIPRHYALQLIDGVARDLYQTRYQTFDDLATYCYGVASTVGLMSMYIVGFKTNKAVPYAIKLGVALQMTNILRDVGEDYRNGRVYLPREELIYYGIRESDLAEGRVTKAWRRFMQFQIERTRQLYEEAWTGVEMLEREGQMSIGAAAVLYSGILDQIEKNDYDVFSKRASLNVWEKFKRFPVLWLKINSL